MFSDSPTVRKVIYGIAIAAQLASFFLVISFPELAAAFVSASGLLAGVAGATALSNITPTYDEATIAQLTRDAVAEQSRILGH